MWNRALSSTYAHLVTAIAVTIGLVVVLLTAHPKKTGMAEIDASARNAPSLASQRAAPANRPGEPAIVHVLQDNRTSGQAP